MIASLFDFIHASILLFTYLSGKLYVVSNNFLFEFYLILGNSREAILGGR